MEHIIKLAPACKDYLWGGRRLLDEYGKSFDGDRLAETWEFSCHPDGPSIIASGAHAGMTLPQWLAGPGKGALGRSCRRFDGCPVLIKLIDAAKDLSIQVHPDNAYAALHEGQAGKTEMWYVVDCEPGAFLYYGFRQEISKEEFARRIADNSLPEVLHAVPVHKGDVFFIEAGTIHAIGKGILIAEIQQSSNVTYRVYDYGRLGADGKPRALHIRQALDVTRLAPPKERESGGADLAVCDYFAVRRLELDGDLQGSAGADSFHTLLVLEGQGKLRCGGEEQPFTKGDSLLLPAGSGAYTLQGRATLLRSCVPPASGPFRIGIDLGGTAIKAGVIDGGNRVAGRAQMPTRAGEGWRQVAAHMAQAARQALADAGIQEADCTALGVGCPGIIDAKSGGVLYSNNLQWENVPLAQELARHFSLPVRVSNDANCAALGEVLAGAARGCKDAVLLTLGTGVGSGIILDGRVFEGGGPGGAEFGHSLLVLDGELCTCGRRGCLEAYASATALIREARAAAQAQPGSLLAQLCEGDLARMDGRIPFLAARQGDPAGKAVVARYIAYLGAGIVNAVNIFRPQVVLLSGGLSKEGAFLCDPLNAIVRRDSFGAARVPVPPVRPAMLGNDAGMIGAANLL